MHKELIKEHSEDTILPQFPTKIYWNKNSEINVQKRAMNLQKYLNELLSHDINSVKDCVFDFIEIEDEVYYILQTTQSFSSPKRCSNHSSFGNESSLSSRYKSLSTFHESCVSQYNLYSNLLKYNNKKSDDNKGRVLVIQEFLQNLEDNKENQGEIVRAFQNFYDENNYAQFSFKEIAMLFKGINSKHQLRHFNEDINSIKPINGLLYHIGNYRQNILGSIACLELLINVLNCDKNYDYERYIQVIKSIDTEYLSMIKCKEIVKASNRQLSKLGHQLCRIFYSNQFEMSKLFNYNDYMAIMEEILSCA